MNAPARLAMSFDRYIEWEKTQERKHELVDGAITLMAGGAAAHNRVCRNALVSLQTRLRGKPREPFGSDMKVRIPADNVRYPDVTIDCGKPKPGAFPAIETDVPLSEVYDGVEFAPVDVL